MTCHVHCAVLDISMLLLHVLRGLHTHVASQTTTYYNLKS